ncbi:hypothetical protein MLDJOKPK_00132 [Salmonella phage SPAsTU]|nr:hypothetical protein STsAS_016 [Salmonella phage STsAS]AWN09062.1 hypothetical protein MLDJOKPK_00132 [Salmonella phage SPAsTU]
MLDSFTTLAEVIPSPDSTKYKVLHDYADFLRKHPETTEEVVDPRYAWPETHSFYAYCRLKEYDDMIIFPMMLMNGIMTPLDFTPDIQTLLVPSVSVVSNILSTIVDA